MSNTDREVYDVVSRIEPCTHDEISSELPHHSTAGVDRSLESMVERGELVYSVIPENERTVLYETP